MDIYTNIRHTETHRHTQKECKRPVESKRETDIQADRQTYMTDKTDKTETERDRKSFTKTLIESN